MYLVDFALSDSIILVSPAKTNSKNCNDIISSSYKYLKLLGKKPLNSNGVKLFFYLFKFIDIIYTIGASIQTGNINYKADTIDNDMYT